jgi:hypothetical protein
MRLFPQFPDFCPGRLQMDCELGLQIKQRLVTHKVQLPLAYLIRLHEEKQESGAESDSTTGSHWSRYLRFTPGNCSNYRCENSVLPWLRCP